jgi:hypothetical protein
VCSTNAKPDRLNFEKTGVVYLAMVSCGTAGEQFEDSSVNTKDNLLGLSLLPPHPGTRKRTRLQGVGTIENDWYYSNSLIS